MEMSLPYRIRTARLLVRCWEPEDAPALKDAIDSSLDHLRVWMPWAQQEPESLEKKLERILRFRAEFADRKSLAYGIFLRSDGRLVGNVSINWRVSAAVADLGYWLRAGVEGRGYITEATVGCLTAAFFHLGMATAEISCNPLNVRSGAVPQRIGFRPQANDVRQTADAKDRISQIWRLDRATFSQLHPEHAAIVVQDASGNELPRPKN